MLKFIVFLIVEMFEFYLGWVYDLVMGSGGFFV